jgi:TonB family protein
MTKPLLIALFIVLYYSDVMAQTTSKDTTLYYLTDAQVITPKKNNATYYVLIIHPDEKTNKNLFTVKEYLINGTLSFVGASKTNNLQDLKLEGSFVSYYPNGNKMVESNYDNGNPVGDLTEYYPNGKLYNIKTYTKTVTEETQLVWKTCSDSTGKIIAENGNGEWINYLNNGYEHGPVVNGVKEGEWYQNINGVEYKHFYKNGNEVKINVTPEFPGGMEDFLKFIGRNLKYPKEAVKNGTSGTVLISFIVEKDGALTDVKVARDIGDGCGDEAVRVIKLSPVWNPGMQDGHPVRVAFSIPVTFTLMR